MWNMLGERDCFDSYHCTVGKWVYNRVMQVAFICLDFCRQLLCHWEDPMKQ